LNVKKTPRSWRGTEQLRKLGYIAGHNIVLERRFAAGHGPNSFRRYRDLSTSIIISGVESFLDP
jgi:hypothetical protein